MTKVSFKTKVMPWMLRRLSMKHVTRNYPNRSACNICLGKHLAGLGYRHKKKSDDGIRKKYKLKTSVQILKIFSEKM